LKLITQNSYYLLIVYFCIFVLVGISFYYVTNYVIQEEFNKILHQRKYLLVKQLSKSDSIIKYQRFSDNTIFIQESSVPLSSFERINDTLIFDQNDKIYLKYRQIHFAQKIRGHYYIMYSRRLLIEKESLAGPLVLLTIFLFLILLVTLFFFNRRVSHKVWKPFYVTLNTLKKYQLQQNDAISFPKTNIDEFDELNRVIGVMINRIRKDFYLLKEFTENTSHELQTPLAIIKSKLELLMQADNLSDMQYKYLSSSLASVNKLSKLNDSLGLLAKIENSQFHHFEKADVSQLIDNKLFNYEDLLKIKFIKVIKENYGTPEIMMNPILADILIENLINNAIKHNIINGEIIINIKSNEISISNTGSALAVDPLLLFQRFSKSNSQSFGLGLSIVKEICDQNNIDISYNYKEYYHWHTITLRFLALDI
jgi:signal transduction histidine kinase